MSDWSRRNARALLREFQAHGLALDLRLTDYTGEDLSGQSFAVGEDLRGGRFRGANLSDARLEGACLAGVDLTDADLTGANLDRADLTGANLTGARLDRASLIGADLSEARLTGTSWHRARLMGTRLPDNAALRGWGAVTPDADPRLQIEPGQASMTSVAWHPSVELLAVGIGQRVVLWDAATAAALATLTGHTNWINAVAFSPDGTRLATASNDGTARIWDTATAAPLATLTGHTGPVNAVAFSPDGTRLATGSHDGTARIWDTATAAPLATLTGHTNWINAVAFSPDGTRLATAGNDGSLWVTDLATLPAPGTPRRKALRRRRPAAPVMPVGPTVGSGGGIINALAYSPDGRQIATGDADGIVTLWQVGSTLTPVAQLVGLPGAGGAAFFGEHRYRLDGDPGGRFWWAAGLCRFEPGELDGYGVERIED